MEFNILNEKNEFKLGTIITVFSLPNTPKEIVLFSVGDYDSSDETVREEATGDIDDNGNEADKNRLWYVAVIAAGVLAAGAAAGWGVLRKRNKM